MILVEQKIDHISKINHAVLILLLKILFETVIILHYIGTE